MPSSIRPELQGLRAVAVLLVLGYHLWPVRVPGGFVGVDVFFVLSGFLITAHLVGEAESSGRISLRVFWARRLRRLLPAASIVLVASFVLMLALVPQSLWQRTVAEIGASALYVQNWVLFSNAADYLGSENQPTLVQHFWSLSVEEQFYLVWPILIAAACAIKPTRSSIAVVLSVVFVASLAVSAAGDAPSYFSTASRAWEFAAGGLLALAAKTVRAAVGVPMSWLGYALIAWSAFAFNGDTHFPGVAALLPVAGTVLVIAAGANGAGALLSRRSITVIGDHSYGIYLWHWPLIVVAPYVLGGSLTDGARLGIAALSVALAFATKRFVEDPLRRGPALRSPRRVFAVSAAVVAMVVAVAAVTGMSLTASTQAAERQSIIAFKTQECYGAAAMVDTSCPRPFEVPNTAVSAFAPVDKGSLGLPCDSKGTDVVTCEFGELVEPARTVAVVGNSFAGQLIAGLEEYGVENSWRIVLMRKTGCTGTSIAEATRLNDADCAAWTDKVIRELLTNNAIDTVIFATNNRSLTYLAPEDTTDEEMVSVRTSIEQSFRSLLDAGKAVISVGAVPGTPRPAPLCVDERHLEYDPCASPRSEGEEEGNVVAEVARTVDGVGEISLLPYLCDEKKCHVVIGGVVVYIDESHLSASFSRSLGPFLGAAVQRHMEVAG